MPEENDKNTPTPDATCPKPNPVYFNRPQRLAQLIGANITVIVAGRRTGKTDSIAAPFVLRNMQRMKGSTGGIVVPTFKHGLTNTIPGLLAAWKRWGFRRGLHYVIGRQPPPTFARPIIEPADYEHVITLYNGSTAVLISQDRPGSSNSLTLSWLLIDEAKFIDYRRLKDETLPANGGIRTHFGRHSCNHSILILSDMPQTQRGSWFLHYRDKMDPQLIQAIEALVCDIYRLRQRLLSHPSAHLHALIRRRDRQLNQLRSVAVYYKEYSSIENLQLLGENYIRQMRRDLTPLTFQTSILCQRIGQARDGFYSSMRDEHLYLASDFAVLDRHAHQQYEGQPTPPLDCLSDADLLPTQPLAIGLDYNANINWLVVGQPTGSRLNILRSFYVKYTRKLPALIDDFCRYYAPHPTHHVIFYYDSTALGSNYAVNDQDFRYVIIHELERHQWTVHDVYLGPPMRHDEKYLLINQAFAHRQRLTPYLNRQNNDDLILALRLAAVARGRNGFRKDKAGEKLAESEEDLLQHRTDGTDAFDTLYIGCERFPQTNTLPAYDVGGVM